MTFKNPRNWPGPYDDAWRNELVFYADIIEALNAGRVMPFEVEGLILDAWRAADMCDGEKRERDVIEHLRDQLLEAAYKAVGSDL